MLSGAVGLLGEVGIKEKEHMGSFFSPFVANFM